MVNDFMPRRKPQSSGKVEHEPQPSQTHNRPIHHAQNILTPAMPESFDDDDTPATAVAVPVIPAQAGTSQTPAQVRDDGGSRDDGNGNDPKHPWWKPSTWLTWFRALTTKKKILFVSIAVLVLALVAGGVFLLLSGDKPAPKKATIKTVTKTEPAKPTTVASTLTGLQIEPTLNGRPVTGVMIENSPDARPQSGLKDAGVVFEAIAEGGITRFLALYQEAMPDYIGPVRSVRPYYVQWAMGFDASLAHVGGSPDALSSIKSWGTKDLDQFAGGAYFWRITQRYAPHNVYTSIDKLDEYATKKGYTGKGFSGFPRKAEKAAATPTAKTINLALSGQYYNVAYTYDVASNSYLRNEGGVPHMDERSNSQLAPKVVVALTMPYSVAGDGVHSIYQTIGSGHMYVFQDGIVTEGTWKKTSNESQFTFTDAKGAAIPLNPGQTWITAVKGNAEVTYAP